MGTLSDDDGDVKKTAKKAVGLGPVHRYPILLITENFCPPFFKKIIRVHT